MSRVIFFLKYSHFNNCHKNKIICQREANENLSFISFACLPACLPSLLPFLPSFPFLNAYDFDKLQLIQNVSTIFKGLGK